MLNGLIVSLLSFLFLAACADTRTPGQKAADGIGQLLTIVFFGWVIWYFATRKRRARARLYKEERRVAEELAALEGTLEAHKRQEAAEAQRAVDEARHKQEKAFADEQSRLDDEALAARLRATVSELIDLANVLTPGEDNAEIVRSMHGTISELAKRQRELKAHHFDDDMLQFDIGLIIKRLEENGLGKDLIVDRLRKVFRQDAPSAPSSTISPSTPPPPTEHLASEPVRASDEIVRSYSSSYYSEKVKTEDSSSKEDIIDISKQDEIDMEKVKASNSIDQLRAISGRNRRIGRHW